jgi:transcriptional regulator GlxA family with amidase domain
MITPKAIGLLVFEEVSSIDLTGAAEVFSRAAMPDGYGSCEIRCYQVKPVGITTEPIVTESGLTIIPDFTIENAPDFDTVIVPGSTRVPAPKLITKLAKWLNYRAPTTRRIAVLGTGIYPLAATGLLDGRKVAVHWKFAKDIAVRFPQVWTNASMLFCKDGPFYSCAGGTSTFDFCLSLTQEDYGGKVALRLARELVVHLKRNGSNEESSPSFPAQSSDRFPDLLEWIHSNLHHDLSIEALAEKACMSRRNFGRLFQRRFGKTPKDFVSSARMSEARRRLTATQMDLQAIAASVGFKSADVFSKAFERHNGVRPSVYRAQLGVSAHGKNGYANNGTHVSLATAHS